ncbi:ABC transporter ATP-binding protein [Amaricoccus sp.]|uniref:ABC transporter ATP-binding protein n=1 Tax=Amaricoccus sp. TaxID=1872485 RepID=UPI001B760A5D|nr:ABC transporter ATP-binding protein [Amaricoccus sp.]MBP7000981.1 ABC transporter ATP-binding protein [Amaricoccus sp.]
MTLLAVEDLVVRYGALTALRGASIRVEEGEIFFVTGPNGAGKSTLMKAIAGVVRAASGAIALAGQPILGEAPETIARRGFSMVPEGRQVFGGLTVEENLRLGAGMRPDRAAVARDLARVYETFPMLAERKGGPAGLLSGGQQQMLVIARALMTDPRLVAIDEPSLGLAPVVIDQVYELLLRLRAERGLTLLIVEQSSTRAMMTGGRMVLMRSGRIVLEGDARTLGESDALERAYFGYEDGTPAA